VIFQVDLFSARGELPNTVLEAAEREKDIRFSSRTRYNTDMQLRLHQARVALRNLLAKLPPDLAELDGVPLLRELAREGAVTVVQLIYRSKIYEGNSKDYEFSRVTMHEHWAAGREDVRRTLAHPAWQTRPLTGGAVTYDLTRDPRAAPS
jgi:NTE family protein